MHLRNGIPPRGAHSLTFHISIGTSIEVHSLMLVRSLFGVLYLCSLVCHGIQDACTLTTIASATELEAIELSTKVHVLLVIKLKDDAQEQSLEDVAITAYPFLPDLENDLEGVVTFSVVDIASHNKNAISTKWHLTKLPALVVYKDPPKENPYTGKVYRDAMILDAEMLKTPRKLKKALKEAIPTEFVQELQGNEATVRNFKMLIQQKMEDEETVVLLISKQKHASPMYRALAAEFSKQGLSFVFLNNEADGADEIVTMLKLEKVPALVVMKSMTEHVVLKAERLKMYNELKGFVEPFATQKKSDGTADMKRNKKGKERAESIKFLTEKEFNNLVMQPEGVWIIEFMDQDRERDVKNEDWMKALTELFRKTGIVTVGAISCEKEPELCERYGGPGVRIFPLGTTDDKKVKRDNVVTQTFATVDEAKETAIATIPDLTVTVASSSEINAFVSYARMDAALPILFLTTKKTVPPLIKALMLLITAHKVKLAVIYDADEDLRKQFLVKASANSALICLVPVQNNLEDPNSVPFGIVAYEKKKMGSFTYPNIMRFFRQVLAEYPHQRDSKTEDVVDLSSFDEASTHLLVPYVTKENIADICTGNTICAIGIFEDHVDTLKEPESRLTKWWTTFGLVAARSKQNKEPFRFMWLNGKCQKAFAATFGVGQFQMPAIVVYSPSKQRFATNMGMHDVESASTFLKSVLSGRIATVPIRDVPELGDECSFDEIHDVTVGADGGIEDDEGLDDMLREILFDEKQQRDELEKELETELKKGMKKKKKSKSKKKKKSKTKTKLKNKKAAHDEL